MEFSHTSLHSTSWASDRLQLLTGARAIYLAELARLAASLRPRFQSGELGDYLGEDADRTLRAPLEQAAAEWFGLEARPIGSGQERVWVGDAPTALLILSVSPSSEDASVTFGWPHVCCAATEAVTRDLLRLAEERGWCQVALETSHSGPFPALA